MTQYLQSTSSATIRWQEIKVEILTPENTDFIRDAPKKNILIFSGLLFMLFKCKWKYI